MSARNDLVGPTAPTATTTKVAPAPRDATSADHGALRAIVGRRDVLRKLECHRERPSEGEAVGSLR